MNPRTQIGSLRTITEYLETRDRIRGMVSDACRTLRIADQEMREIASLGLTTAAVPKNSEAESLREIDRMFWRRAFDLTGFGSIMDAREKRRFEESVSGPDCPEFTEANIRSTFGDLYQSADMMWRRGVVNVFRRLSKQYATNEAFRVNRKIVMRYMLGPMFNRPGLAFRHGAGTDEINDIDRVLCRLDGDEFHERALEMAINEAFAEPPCVYEDSRIKARGYRNGNLHLWIQRDDLLDRINEIIAEHYGATLGAA